MLHIPAIPFLRRLYKQHTLHHAITRIARKPGRDGRGILFIENRYPDRRTRAGRGFFFPVVFAGGVRALDLAAPGPPAMAAPLLPWFLAGYLTLAVSLALYEVLHAINHWPFEKWEPLIRHRLWGRVFMPAYAFHLRHHAVIDCNESISGFLGLPIADWTFATCVIPQTVYADGEEWTADKFRSPKPRWIIRQLDTWANSVVRRRRALAAETTGQARRRPCPPPRHTRAHLHPRGGNRELGHPWHRTGRKHCRASPCSSSIRACVATHGTW